MKKKIIVIENAAMLQQLIEAFGTCICTTVWAQFPPGPKLLSGSTVGQAIKKLKESDKVNSIIELDDNELSNEDVEYTARQKECGVDFRYDFAARKFMILVRYSRIKADNTLITSFYGDIICSWREFTC